MYFVLHTYFIGTLLLTEDKLYRDQYVMLINIENSVCDGGLFKEIPDCQSISYL